MCGGIQSFLYPPLNCFSCLTLLWSSPTHYCTLNVPCSKCLVPELLWIGDFILKYLNTYEISLGWDPSLNMNFIYICLLKVIYSLFMVHLHPCCNLSHEGRDRFFISDTLLAPGKSWISDPHRFCSFGLGMTKLIIISSKCKSYVLDLCSQVL